MSPPHRVQAPMPPSGQGLGLSSLPPASARRKRRLSCVFGSTPGMRSPQSCLIQRGHVHGWRLTGSKTCPTPAEGPLLCCLLLHLAPGFTTFPLKCSAPRSPASFLPPGGTVIKLLQRDTHEEHDLRPGYLRQSPAAVGWWVWDAWGWAGGANLSGSQSPGAPAGGGPVLTWLPQRPPPPQERCQDSPNAGPPLGPFAITGLLSSCPCSPRGPQAQAPTVSGFCGRLCQSSRWAVRLCKDRTACAQRGL